MQNKIVQFLAVLVFMLLVLNHGKAIISLLIPVILACFFMLLLLPLVDTLENKFRSRLAATLAVLTPAFTAIFWALWLLITRLYREAQGFVKSIPELVNTLEKTFNDRIWPLVQGTQYEDTFFVILDEIVVRGIGTLQSIAMRLIESGILLLGALPGLFVGLMVTIILAFYFIHDKKWILEVIPGATDNVNRIIHSIHGFIRVQFFLITITAGICMFAFQLLGIPYVFAFGATIAIFDLLPILGAGTLLIPMVVWYLLMGMPFVGVSIAILYIVIIAVRQVVEPKLISTNLGIHPIVAILCLFLGLQLFGLMGLVLLPLIASIAASFPRFQWLKR
jgi:sporulation integral membrane protein YtvI